MLELDGKENSNPNPTVSDVEKAAAKIYQISPVFSDPEIMKAKLKELSNHLDANLVGQVKTKAILKRLVMQRAAKTNDKKKPAISVLLAGPPGVGKTAIGGALGKALDLPVVRVEMNAYTSLSDGVDEFRRALAAIVRKNAFSIIILDELEKAPRIVQDALLAILDSGETRVSESISSQVNGPKTEILVNFRNAHFIATTNAGQDYILNGGRFRLDEFKREIIAGEIPDRVIDRFQAVIPAFPPSESEFKEIVRLHLQKFIREQCKRQKLQVQIDNEDDFLNFVVKKELHRIEDEKGQKESDQESTVLNARTAQRYIQDFVRYGVAEKKLLGSFQEGEVLSIHFDPSCLSVYEFDEES
jgi:ATP-dependent Clp protease ATP-binding subunit ClpB